MNPEPQPTAEALSLAHEIMDIVGLEPTTGRVDSYAKWIDRRLLLPQKNAALFAAQAVCDAAERKVYHLDKYLGGTFAELRAALAAIKTKP